jgi:hypothetical protein
MHGWVALQSISGRRRESEKVALNSVNHQESPTLVQILAN